MLALGAALIAGGAHAAPSLSDPALSPDGREIAFVSGGDIWTVPAQGGVARLLVTDPATESRPLYSPDGTKLAFTSNRAGSTNIYILTLATGDLKRLTYADTNEVLDGWSRDGKWIYFSSPVNDVARQNDIFRVSAEGGTPLEVSRERYLNEFESAPSPDGKTIALMARGLSNVQWWRNGHSHIDETELWLKTVNAAGGYTRLLPSDAKHAFPMWSPDGAAIYYMSDASGAENIWRTPVQGGAPQQVTHFTDGRVLWPTIGYDGASIVFERGFGIWRLDTATGEAKPVDIRLLGAPASAGQRHLVETSFRQMALSPDGKKVAVIAHGEVFAAPTKDGGPAQRITHTAAEEGEVVWAPDSRRLVYVSERGADKRLVQYDFVTGKEIDLTHAPGVDAAPVFAPDGKSIAYAHGSHELRLITLSPGGAASDRLVYTGPLGDDPSPAAFSPDGKWLAFVVTDHKAFSNIHVVDTAGGTARPITFLANGNTGSKIAWSPDGTFIVFDTAQRSEPSKLVRVDLLPHVPKYREDAFQTLFKPATTPDKPSDKPSTQSPDTAPAHTPAHPDDKLAKADKTSGDEDAKEDGDKGAAKPKVKPVRIVFEGIRERATILPLGMSAQGPVISPDGKTLVFSAQQGEHENLYSYSLDELAAEPPSPQQITATERGKQDYAFTPDSKTLFYRENGRVISTPLDGPKPKPLAVTAEMDVDFDVEKTIVFEEAWSTLDRRFYDPAFHGKDWDHLRAVFAPQIEGAHTPDEMRRLINEMIGELDASHSGINGPSSPNPAPVAHVGDLGLRFDRAAYEAGKGLVVREVIALGPCEIEGSIKPGARLVSLDGAEIGPHDNLDERLLGKVGRRTVLGVVDASGHAHEAVVRPVTVQVAGGLLYRQWVNERRAYVEKISGGKIGYVHIPDMGDESLAQLYLDLDAQNQAKQGVVVDIRNNNGGYINGYALDVFTRRNYLNMTQRDLGFPVPSRSALGQRALGLPTALVTNESSLSDAEDFSEGYRSLGLGKIVGQPTAGWIIYTSGRPLIDGSVVRVPNTRVQDLRGQTMEGHPRPVDITVERPLGETEAGTDAQLDAAVKTLLTPQP